MSILTKQSLPLYIIWAISSAVLVNNVCFAYYYVETEEREDKPLETIKDNFPKYILTRSDPIQHRNSIIHKNMPELVKNGELF